MEKTLVVSLVVIVLITYWLLNNRNMKTYTQYMKRKQRLEESIKDFVATQTFSNQNVAMAINQNEEKFCISTMKNGAPVPLFYEFKDIIGSEIIEERVPGTKPSGSGQSNRNTTTNIQRASEKIMKVDLKINFNDSENPFVLANFLFWEVSKNSKEYKNALEDATYWHNIIIDLTRKHKKK